MKAILASFRVIVVAAVLAVNPLWGGQENQKAVAKSPASATHTAELRTDSGLLRGLVVGQKQDVQVYKGIPYAAPPVGGLRWKAPQPIAGWQGVRDCFEFGAACPQTVSAMYKNIPEMDLNAPMNEDCLFLNVWTPAAHAGGSLPVLYWIHGGGYTTGAASQPLYDGEKLARFGCVVVSINYRLGPLGFLAHPALSRENKENISGNYGLLDQIEGLRWVKRNIAVFGGDANRVAIFGESAGGGSVLCLMVSPLAKGLFQRAIAQSAAGSGLAHLHESQGGNPSAENAGQRMMAACGLSASANASQMRGLGIDTLLKFSSSNERPPAGELRLKRLRLGLGPIVDGHVIPDEPDTIFAAGREDAVPLIIGNTKDEMSLFMVTAKMPANEAAYLKTLKASFGDQADSIAKAYPAKEARQIRPSVIQLSSDLAFACGTRSIAREHAAAGQKTFRYEFARGTKRGFLQFLGAHHGAELAFVFQRPAKPDDPIEQRISQTMGRYWVNFAATGDPNGPGLPNWPACRQGSDDMVEIADDVKVLTGHRNEQLDAIEIFVRAASPGGKTKEN